MSTSGRFLCYLDLDSLIELSKDGSTVLRDRFLVALRRRGLLAFSWTQAIEIGRLAGDNLRRVRDFLCEIGPLWLPFEMKFGSVLEREASGGAGPPLSHRMAEHALLMTKGIVGTFPSPVAVLDFVELERSADKSASASGPGGWLRTQQGDLLDTLVAQVQSLHAKMEKEGVGIDKVLPPVAFHVDRRCAFVFNHLLRHLTLTARSHTLTLNDAMDFLHAVVAVGYCRVVALDKRWKERVESIPKPNDLGRVYFRAELDQVVDRFEYLVSQS